MSVGVVDADFFDLFRFELGIFLGKSFKFSPCNGCVGARSLVAVQYGQGLDVQPLPIMVVRADCSPEQRWMLSLSPLVHRSQ